VACFRLTVAWLLRPAPISVYFFFDLPRRVKLSRATRQNCRFCAKFAVFAVQSALFWLVLSRPIVSFVLDFNPVGAALGVILSMSAK